MTFDTVRVTLRDGVRLATDVYRPEGPGPFPVVIIRTPYRRAQLALFNRLCGHGCALIIQDVRGTGESEGEFGFLAQEPDDALDTAAWLLEQPWCDGRFGLIGVSYLAGASIAIAAAMPERVKACIWVTMPLKREWLSWHAGALRLHHGLPWTWLAAGRKLGGQDWPSLYRTLPLATASPDLPLWQTLCGSEDETADFWRRNDLSAYIDQVQAPGLHFAGWYDFMADAAIEPYQLLASRAEGPQRLIIGPYSHNTIIGDGDGCGDIHYGDRGRPGFVREVGAWFDTWFHGAALPETAPVRAFLPGGEGRWVALPGWGQGTRLDLYLTADGCLTGERSESGRTGFVSDPADPVPTQGGAVWEFPAANCGLEPGPAIQTTAARDDVLTFSTGPLASELIVCGTATVSLTVTADGSDCDFTAKLCDVAPDGTARYVCDGIIRTELTPGSPKQIDITMICGHAFLAGHQLNLEIAGSNFPKYDRNPRAGRVRQTVDCGASRISLPLIG